MKRWAIALLILLALLVAVGYWFAIQKLGSQFGQPVPRIP